VGKPGAIIACLLLLGVASASARQTADMLGTWSGSWEGAGSTGAFEIVLEKGSDGKTTGSVAVDNPAYKVALRTVTFDGPKMIADYDFPPDPQLEIRLTATFDGKKATGTWQARQKGAGTEVVAGTWTVAKK
jgi:hypothetical protein